MSVVLTVPVPEGCSLGDCCCEVSIEHNSPTAVFQVAQGDPVPACGSFPAWGDYEEHQTRTTGVLGAVLKCGESVLEADSWLVELLSYYDNYLFCDPSACPASVAYQAYSPFTPETSPAGGSFSIDDPTNPNTTFTISDQSPFLAFTGLSGNFSATIRITAMYKGLPFYVDAYVLFTVEAAP